MAKRKTSTSNIQQEGTAPLAGLNYQNYNDATWDTLRLIRDTSYVNRMTPERRAMLSGRVAIPETTDERSTPFLESQYDNPNAYYSPFEPDDFYSNINDYRGYAQPWYTQLANGISKGLIKVGTTFIDGTLGLITGLGKWVATGEFSSIWDNPITNTMQTVDDWTEKNLPNYYTNEEMETPWWSNIFTANFIGDKFLKNIGFTVGAYYSGKVWAMPLQLLGKAGKAGKILDLVKTAEQSGNLSRANRITSIGEKILNSNRYAQSVVGSFISAVNEGSIEALNNSRDFYNTKNSELLRANQEINQQIDEQVDLGLMTEEQAIVAKEQEAEKLKTAQEALREKVTKMGNADLLMNVPILMASNLWQFGKLYNNGWKIGREGLKGSIKDGYEVTLGKYSGLRKGISNALVEGTEEWAQKAAATAADVHYGDDIMEYYKKGKSLEDNENAAAWLGSIGSALNKTWNDGSSWEEFFIGALTGALGIPTAGKNSSDTRVGGKYFGLEGGIFGESKYYNSLRRKNQEFAEYVEKRRNNPESNFENYYKGLSRHFSIEKDMQKAIANGDKFSYKNSEFAQMISDIEMFSRVGKTQDLIDFIEYATGGEITAEDISIAREMTNKQNLTQSEIDELRNLEKEYAEVNSREEELGSKLQQEIRDTYIALREESGPAPFNVDEQSYESSLYERAEEIVYNNHKGEIDALTEEKRSITEQARVIKGKSLGTQEGVFIDKTTQEEKTDDQVARQIEKQRDVLVSTIKRYNDTLKGIRNSSWGQNLSEEELRNAVYIQMQSSNFVDRISELGETLKPGIRAAVETLQAQKAIQEMVLNNTPEEKQSEKDKKNLEATKKNIDTLQEYLNSDNPFILGYSFGSMPEVLNFLQEVLDESNSVSTEVTEKVNESFRDLPKLVKALNYFNDTIKEYQKDPKKIGQDIANADNTTATTAEKTAINKYKQQFKNVNSLSEFRELADNIEDIDLLNTVLAGLEEEDNQYVKDYFLLQDIASKMQAFIRDAEEVDDSIKSQGIEVLNSFLSGVESFDDVKNFAKSIDSIIEEQVKDVDLTLELETQQRVKSIVGDAINSVVQNTEYIDTLRKKHKEANKKEDSKDNNDKDKENDNTIQDSPIAYGNITTQDLTEDAEDNGEIEEEKDKKSPHKYYHPIIPEMGYNKNGTLVRFIEVEGKDQYKSVYEFLQNTGAFDYVNSGKLKEGDTIHFVISEKYNEDTGRIDDPTIFMAVKNGNEYQIVGVLPAGNSAVGLDALRQSIINQYKGGNKVSNTDSNNSSENDVPIDSFLGSFIERIKRDIEDPSVLNDFVSRVKAVKLAEGDERPELGRSLREFLMNLKIKGSADEGKLLSNIEKFISKVIDSSYTWEMLVESRGTASNNTTTSKPTNNTITIANAGEGIVATETTKVAKMMTGKVQYKKGDNAETDLGALFEGKENQKDDTIFAIVNGKGDLIVPRNLLPRKSIIKKNKKNLVPGRLYLLVKTGANTYIPTAVRVKHFNDEEFSTVSDDLKKNINSYINKIAKISEDFNTNLKAILQELKNDLYIGTVNINFINKDSESPTLAITPLLVNSESGRFVQDSNNFFVEDKENRKVIHYTGKSTSQIVEEITNALKELNLPFQVSIRDLNIKAYNKRKINYNILTTNLQSLDSVDNWFVTDYFDNGEIVSATPPAGLITFSEQTGNNLLGGEENTTNEVKTILNGQEVLINREKKTVTIEGNTMLWNLHPTIKSSQQWEDIAWAAEFASDQNSTKYNFKGVPYAIIKDGKDFRVINLNTGKYVAKGLKKFILHKTAHIVDNSIEEKRNKSGEFLRKLVDHQQQVNKEKTTSDYYVIYEIGSDSDVWSQRIELYDRVHKKREEKFGSLYITPLSENAKRAGEIALSFGTQVDSIVREFFDPKRKHNVARPDNISEKAFDSLITALENLKNQFEISGEKVFANNLVVFNKVTNPKTGEEERLAGEIDLLTIDAVGDIRIYDIKTSKESRYTGNNLSQRFVTIAKNGKGEDLMRRSIKTDHEIQISSYADMIENKYNVPVEGIYEIPIHLDYSQDTKINDIELEKTISLDRRKGDLIPYIYTPLGNKKDDDNNNDDDNGPENPPEGGQWGTTNVRINIPNTTNRRRRKEKFRLITSFREKWNQEKEMAWLDRVLPQLNKEHRVLIAKGLTNVAKNGVQAWGQYWQGIIVLGENADKGTLYHEAFHVVFDLMTTDKERAQLFEEARKKWGNIASEIDLEELMAEEFREYTESRATIKPKGLGRKIIDFFKSLWAKITGHPHIKNYLEAYYARINNGEFSKVTLNTSSHNKEIRFRNSTSNNIIESSSMRKNMEEFFSNFGISINDLTEYSGKEPIFDALGRTIYTTKDEDLIDSAGQAIAFMIQHDRSAQEFLKDMALSDLSPNSTRKVRMLEKKQRPNKSLIINERWKAMDKKPYVNRLGNEIASVLKQFYNIKDSNFTERHYKRIFDIIDNFYTKFNTYEYNRYLALKGWIQNIANSIILNDKTVILGRNVKPGDQEQRPTNRVYIEQALLEFPYEENIISMMNSYNIALAGSPSIALSGSLYRPEGNPLHDLDFAAPGRTAEELQNILSKHFKSTKLFNTIINDDGTRTETFIVLDREFETVKGKGMSGTVIDPKTKEVLGTYKNWELSLKPGINGKFLDFFIGPQKYGQYYKKLNGKDYLISNYNNALAAKIDWQREKDIWDYNRFVHNEFTQKGIFKSGIQKTPLSQRIKDASILWVHPAMGKTHYIQNGNDVIDWDDEFLEKKVNLVKQLAKKHNVEPVVINTNVSDYKKLSDLYYSEWERVKEKARAENKKIITGSLDLLTMFKEDFEVFINLPQQTFIERNMARSETNNYYGSLAWKQGLNNQLITVDSNDVYTTTKYFSEIMREAYGLSWATLNPQEIEELSAQGWTKELFNAIPEDAKEKAIQCIGF